MLYFSSNELKRIIDQTIKCKIIYLVESQVEHNLHDLGWIGNCFSDIPSIKYNKWKKIYLKNC